MNKALFPALLALPLVGCHSSNPLRNDAYDYYGLGNTKTLKLQIVRGENGLPEEATRTVVPGKVEDGKETYVLKQTGGLETEGDITLSLEKDGVYAMSSSRNKIKPHSLEMPAKLEVGGGWKDHTEMSDQRIVLDNDLKIVNRERVTTPGGTFDDALHVTSTGSGLYGGGPVTLTTESWYVRGTGPVKQIVNVVPKMGPKQSFTIQLAPDKPAEAAPAAGSAGGAKK